MLSELAVTLTLAVLVLVAACANEDESSSPVVPTTASPNSLVTQVVVPPSLSRLNPEEASPGEEVEIEAIGGLVGLDTCAQHASDRQQWTTVIPG